MIGRMYRWAISQDILDHDPTKGIATYSLGKLRERVLSPEEIKLLWEWLGTMSTLAPGVVDVLKLQMALGARIGEVGGIEAAEIDQDEWTWTLPASRSKSKRARVTPLVGLAKEIIARRLIVSPDGAFFRNERGKPIGSNDVGRALHHRRERLPIGHFVTHDIRRTVATQLIELGISYELAAAVLGHIVEDKNVRVLVRHYVRTDLVTKKRRALEAWDIRLNEILAGKVATTNVVRLSHALQGAV